MADGSSSTVCASSWNLPYRSCLCTLPEDSLNSTRTWLFKFNPQVGMWIWFSTPVPLDGLFILDIVPKAGFTNQLQYSSEPGAKGSGKTIRHPGTWEMEKYTATHDIKNAKTWCDYVFVSLSIRFFFAKRFRSSSWTIRLRSSKSSQMWCPCKTIRVFSIRRCSIPAFCQGSSKTAKVADTQKCVLAPAGFPGSKQALAVRSWIWAAQILQPTSMW